MYNSITLEGKLRKALLKLIKEKRGVSPAISNVIMVGAVIAVGFSTLIWAQSLAYSYSIQYSEAINADIERLKEKLTFEYVYYNTVNKSLYVYLLNCGAVDNVNITTIYVCFVNGTIVQLYQYSSFTLKSFSGSIIADHELDRGDEGYIELSQLNLASENYFLVRVVTERGSNFDCAFAV